MSSSCRRLTPAELEAAARRSRSFAGRSRPRRAALGAEVRTRLSPRAQSPRDTRHIDRGARPSVEDAAEPRLSRRRRAMAPSPSRCRAACVARDEPVRRAGLSRTPSRSFGRRADDRLRALSQTSNGGVGPSAVTRAGVTECASGRSVVWEVVPQPGGRLIPPRQIARLKSELPSTGPGSFRRTTAPPRRPGYGSSSRVAEDIARAMHSTPSSRPTRTAKRGSRRGVRSSWRGSRSRARSSRSAASRSRRASRTAPRRRAAWSSRTCTVRRSASSKRSARR